LLSTKKISDISSVTLSGTAIEM